MFLSLISNNYKETINVSIQSLSLYKVAYIISTKKNVKKNIYFLSYSDNKTSIYDFKVTKYAVCFIESSCKTLQNCGLNFTYVKEIFVTTQGENFV